MKKLSNTEAELKNRDAYKKSVFKKSLVFCGIRNFLIYGFCEKRCSLKCCKIHRKIPVPEPLF